MNDDTLGALIIDLKDKTLSPEEVELLAHPLVGGIILFTRNYESPAQIKNLCQQIKASRKKSHQAQCFIMVDQEGGRVQRFIPGFSRIPPMASFGKTYDETDPKTACEEAKKWGHTMAKELLA